MKIRIRQDLTPENAKQLGFVWWKDTIYDLEAPKEAMEHIVEMVESGEWVLGTPATRDPIGTMVGLYKKLVSKAKTN